MKPTKLNSANETIVEKDDVEKFRNPKEYIRWFEDRLEAIHNDRSLKNAARAHVGIFKKFYEEMFPLYSLLRVKRKAWAKSEFRNILGSQKYDVEVRGNDLGFLEIVTTDFDDAELLRGHVLTANGSVDAIAPVKRDDSGRPIGFWSEGDCRLHDDVVSEVVLLAESRLRAKCKKSYPAKTGLVVNVDDYKTNPSDSDWRLFSTMVEAERTNWADVFEAVYVVGPRGRSCVEIIR